MPHRRVIKKGSFGGHFDELVKHFPDRSGDGSDTDERGKPAKDKRHINDRLFESAWRKAREQRSQTD